jgi:hypothetical protein
LPEADRSRVLAELGAATAVLRERALIHTLSDEEKNVFARRRVKEHRPMVPGFLMLERRVQDLWRPFSPEPGGTPRVTWLVAEYLPQG